MNTINKNYCAILALAMLVTSCERSIDINVNKAPVQLSAANEAANSKCRFVYGSKWSNILTEQYSYNADGLLEVADIQLFGFPFTYATMQYDDKNKLNTSTVSINGGPVFNMSFEYENNRIVREITYEPGTNNIIEILVNTYNNKGQVIRRSDATYDIYTDFEYDSEGNSIKNETHVLSTGELIFGQTYNYSAQVKSAETVRPGLTQAWWYINEVVSPFVPTRRGEYWSDGAGGIIVTYDEDESQTVITGAVQNLPSGSQSFDLIFGVQNYFSWEYENCGGKAGLNGPVTVRTKHPDSRAKDIALLRMPLVRGPGLNKQLSERKAIYQRIKN